MTLSIGDFRKLARVDSNDYVARDDINGGFKLEPEALWHRRHRTNWHVDASNEARRAFVDCLKREYPHIAALIDKEIAPHLSENGRPLKSWHVQEVLDRVDRMLAADKKATIHDPRILVAAPELCLDADEVKNLEKQLQPAAKVTASGEIPKDALDLLFEEDPSFGDFEENLPFGDFEEERDKFIQEIDRELNGRMPGAGEHKPKSVKALDEPEAVTFTPSARAKKSGDPEGPPQAAPPAPEPPAAVPQVQPPVPAAAAAPAASPSPTASRGVWGAHRQPPQRKESKGKGPEEPRAEPKSDPANSEAKLIQDTAWKKFSPFLEATVKHVAKAEDEAAKSKFGKFKKKIGVEAAEAEGQFKLIGGKKEFADLFVKPRKLAHLDQLLAKQKPQVTTNPLSFYFDLPRIMGDIPPKKDGYTGIAEPGRHWLFRMRNAGTKLDAQQVIKEIEGTIKQLGEDIQQIENSMPARGKDRDLLVDATRQLRSMERFLKEESSPLMELKARCTELVKVLPEEPPSIPHDKYLALVALEEMGIDVDPHQDPKETPKLVELANRMRTVHDLLRRGMMEGETWQDIYDDPKSDKKLLEEYRELRLKGIKQKVSEGTPGVVMNLVAGTDGKKLYHFTIDGNEDERHGRYRQINHLLSTIAFSMGGTYLDLANAFGYQETTLERLAAEQRAKEQADQAD
jgi:hypothetical protein